MKEYGSERILAGCIPCSVDGKMVLMITSRSYPELLVFPKGGVEKGESFEEAAIRETYEEAGIRGNIRGNGVEISGITWFELLVTEELDDWPEKKQRSRKWV